MWDVEWKRDERDENKQSTTSTFFLHFVIALTKRFHSKTYASDVVSDYARNKLAYYIPGRLDSSQNCSY